MKTCFRVAPDGSFAKGYAWQLPYGLSRWIFSAKLPQQGLGQMTERMLYAINEGTLPLDVPGTWEDQTIHALRVLGEGRAAVSLVITRQSLPIGMEVADYAEAQVAELKRTLPGFELHGRVPMPWRDVTGEALLTRWHSEEGPMDQVIVCRQVGGPRLLIFTATHPTPFPTPTYEAVMAAIQGFVPRGGEPQVIDPR